MILFNTEKDQSNINAAIQYFYSKIIVMKQLLLVGLCAALLMACGNDSPTSILPDISEININRSDQFLVDMDDVADGQMHRGKNSSAAHPGAHIHFQNNVFNFR